MNINRLIEQAQRLNIVQPEVLTGRHHPAPGRTPAAALIKREAATVGRRQGVREVQR